MRWPWDPKPSEIWDAIAQGDLAKVEKLLDGGLDVNTVDRQGRCLLSAAIIAEKPDIATLIIGRDPNLNLQDVNGWAPLHFAARHYLPDVVALLIEKEARIDIRDVRGNTPLYRAVFESRGRGEVIQLLLAHKANPRKRNKLGVSPIELASLITNFNVKQFLSLPSPMDDDDDDDDLPADNLPADGAHDAADDIPGDITDNIDDD